MPHPLSTDSSRKRLLIVERDFEFRNRLADAVARATDVEIADDLAAANARLVRTRLDLIAINIELGSRGALDLASVLAAERHYPRLLAYSNAFDPSTVQEFQQARAFCEMRARLPYALPAYLDARLPLIDRRNPVHTDRRTSYRGGRRASDLPPTTLQA